MSPDQDGFLFKIANLCRFRGGPQDLPHNPGFLVALLVASVALDLVTATILEIGDSAPARSLFSTALLLALCWLALAIRGLLSRYVQTATALISCSMVFSLIIVPLALLFGPPASPEEKLTPIQTMLALLGLGVLIWKISVDANNMRQAIDASFWIGFALVLSWSVADFALGRVLFGGAA